MKMFRTCRRLRPSGLALVLIFGMSALCFAASGRPRRPGEVRVVITFKTKLSAGDRQNLHLDLKTSFMQHFKSSNSDLVGVHTGRKITLDESRQLGRQLCERYLKVESVRACVPAL